jgi:hypothetical protein
MGRRDGGKPRNWPPGTTEIFTYVFSSQGTVSYFPRVKNSYGSMEKAFSIETSTAKLRNKDLSPNWLGSRKKDLFF